MPSEGQRLGIATMREEIDYQKHEIVEKACKMGLTHEIRDLLEGVEDLRSVLRRKSYELDVLEALAMESDDENITALREQLFTTVKLVHSDIINEVLDQFKKMPQPEEGFVENSMVSKKKLDKRGLIDRIRAWHHNRSEVRKQLKHVKAMLIQQKNQR